MLNKLDKYDFEETKKAIVFTDAVAFLVLIFYILFVRKKDFWFPFILKTVATGTALIFAPPRKKKSEELGKIHIEARRENLEINGKEAKLTFTPFFNPYTRDRKTTITEFTDDKKGLYFIRNAKTKEVVYIGYSTSNLYKTMYRHFQEWQDPRQYRATYPKFGFEVAIAIPDNLDLITDIEKYFILLYKPVDNEQKYEQYNISFDDDSDTIDLPEEQYTVEDEPPF